MRDPRQTRRYTQARAAWLPTQTGGTCILCTRPVDVTLPGTHPLGPTVEHTLPMRVILATATSWPHAVDLACDVTLWALAHRRCQNQQGAQVSNRTRHGHTPGRTPSRDW